MSELKNKKDAVPEIIENNVRKMILKEELNDPAFYARMSAYWTRSSPPARRGLRST